MPQPLILRPTDTSSWVWSLTLTQQTPPSLIATTASGLITQFTPSPSATPLSPFTSIPSRILGPAPDAIVCATTVRRSTTTVLCGAAGHMYSASLPAVAPPSGRPPSPSPPLAIFAPPPASSPSALCLCITADPAADRVYAGYSDGRVRVFTLTGTKMASFSAQRGAIRVLCLQGHALFSGSEDQSIVRFNVKTGKPTLLYQGFSGPIRCLTVHSNVLYFNDDRSVRGQSIETGKVVAQLTGHPQPVFSLALNSSSSSTTTPTLLATGCQDATIRIFSLATNTLLLSLPGHSLTVKSLLFWSVMANSYLASGSQDGTIRVWRVIEGHTLQVVPCEASSAAPVTSTRTSAHTSVRTSAHTSATSATSATSSRSPSTPSSRRGTGADRDTAGAPPGSTRPGVPYSLVPRPSELGTGSFGGPRTGGGGRVQDLDSGYGQVPTGAADRGADSGYGQVPIGSNLSRDSGGYGEVPVGVGGGSGGGSGGSVDDGGYGQVPLGAGRTLSAAAPGDDDIPGYTNRGLVPPTSAARSSQAQVGYAQVPNRPRQQNSEGGSAREVEAAYAQVPIGRPRPRPPSDGPAPADSGSAGSDVRVPSNPYASIIDDKYRA